MFAINDIKNYTPYDRVLNKMRLQIAEALIDGIDTYVMDLPTYTHKVALRQIQKDNEENQFKYEYSSIVWNDGSIYEDLDDNRTYSVRVIFK